MISNLKEYSPNPEKPKKYQKHDFSSQAMKVSTKKMHINSNEWK